MDKGTEDRSEEDVLSEEEETNDDRTDRRWKRNTGETREMITPHQILRVA
jgi:hypothetical protein